MEWTPEEIEFLESALSAGMTDQEIGRRLGRSSEAVRSKRRRANLERTEPRVEQTEDLNEITLSSTAPHITTPDQLIEFCQIDRDVWEPIRQDLNKWDVQRRREEKDLRWVDGKPEGYVRDHGDMHKSQSLQVKVILVRKEPIAVFPTIQPIQTNFKFTAPPRPINKSVQTALILSDIQAGFWRVHNEGRLLPLHDRQALDVVLQIAQEHRPDHIVMAGDGLDLAEWSDKYLRSPELLFTTQPTIQELHWWLAMFRIANVDAVMYYLQGNHDLRMETSVVTHLNAAYNLKAARQMHLPPALSVPHLLQLHELGIEWVGDYPNGRIWLNNWFQVEHGRIARKPPGSTARALLDEYDQSIATGHNHRLETAYDTMYGRGNQRFKMAMTTGCLCQIGGKVPGRYQDQGWQNGFGWVEFTENEFDANVFSIQNGSTIFQGQVYEARSEDEIRKQAEADLDYRLH